MGRGTRGGGHDLPRLVRPDHDYSLGVTVGVTGVTVGVTG